MKLELWYPTKPWKVNQAFGKNDNNFYKEMGMAGHNGIDAYAPDGWVVRAAHDGVVTFAGEDGTGGMGIVIRTHDEMEYESVTAYFKTIYWHLRKDGILVQPGQSVKVGEIIGLADNTGISTGSHLHFGLKPVVPGENDWTWGNLEQNNGYYGAIDPAPYFNGYHAEDAVKVLDILNRIKDTLAKAVPLLLEMAKTLVRK